MDVRQGTAIFHDYVQMLASVYYAKNSDNFFPFEVDGHKFDWETFKKVHE